MNEAVLKALSKGATSAPVVLLMASRLEAMLTGLLEKKADLDPVLVVSFESVHSVAKALLFVSGAPNTSEDDFEQIFTSKSGPAYMTKQLLNQNPFWIAECRKAREAASARKVLGPEVNRIEKHLAAGELTVSDFPAVARRMTAWMEGLRQGWPFASSVL